MKNTKPMTQYTELAKRVLETGVESDDRTGVGTIRVFGADLRFDLNDGFPLVGVKLTDMRNIAVELFWFLSGSSNTQYLHDQGVHFWDEWADGEGRVGRSYGYNWRGFDGSCDQIGKVLGLLRTDPNSRRMLVTSWNPKNHENDNKAGFKFLPPYHHCFQFLVINGKLNCKFNMRSSDVFLGLPYNIASYALLTHIFAHISGLEVGEVIYSGSDVHIYKNHIEAAKKMVARTIPNMPTISLGRDLISGQDLRTLDLGAIEIHNYFPHPHMRIKVAV